MSPLQLKKLQELRLVFSQGKANPKQIHQLSSLLAQINCSEGAAIYSQPEVELEQGEFIAAPWLS